MRRSINDNNLITLINPKSKISEAFRSLRTNIQYSAMDSQLKVIMVTSAQKEEGKTTTVSNLAVAYAQEGKKVLLIDTDLRRPSLHQVFMQSNRVGLTSLLAYQLKWQEVVKDTMQDNLSIITSGPIPPNPSEMLGNQRMQLLVEELREHYDIILIDTPPILAVTDGLVMNSLCDGVILVVIAGKVEKELVKKAKANLDYVNARIIGIVFNKINRKDVKATLNYEYGVRD